MSVVLLQTVQYSYCKHAFLVYSMACMLQALPQTKKHLPLQDLGTEENAGDTRNVPAGPPSQDLQEPCPDRSYPVYCASTCLLLLVHSICASVCSVLNSPYSANGPWCVAIFPLTRIVINSWQLARQQGCQSLRAAIPARDH